MLERDHGCDFSVDVCLLPHVHFGPNRDAENKTFELELFFQTKNWSGNTSSEKSTRPVSLTPAYGLHDINATDAFVKHCLLACGCDSGKPRACCVTIGLAANLDNRTEKQATL